MDAVAALRDVYIKDSVTVGKKMTTVRKMITTV